MQSIDSMIEVLQAYKDGKKIEARNPRHEGDGWYEAPVPEWMFGEQEYRVKEERIVQWAAVEKSGDVAFSSSNPYMTNAWIKNQKGLYRTVKLVEDSEHEPQ